MNHCAGPVTYRHAHQPRTLMVMWILRFSLRQMILALIIVGMLGLGVELLLLEHFDAWQQWLPLALLAIGVPVAAVAGYRESPGAIKTFGILMAIYVLTGLLGLYFHLEGNIEFALERDPSLHGIRLIWKALSGATPVLAAGALVQLGLLGLAYSFRHPAFGPTATTQNTSAE